MIGVVVSSCSCTWFPATPSIIARHPLHPACGRCAPQAVGPAHHRAVLRLYRLGADRRSRRSFRNGDPVTVTLLERLPATVSLGLVGIVIALLIALPAGIWSALHEGR